MGVFQPRAALEDRHAGLFEGRDIGRLEARDLLVLVGDERRPVEHGMMQAPSEARRVVNVVDAVGRSQ